MFVVMYRWRIKPELAKQFVENWSVVTEYYLKFHGSLGSRLHLGSDGIYYAYAQWPDDVARDKAFANERTAAAFARMKECIEESFEEAQLNILSDLIRTESKK